MCKAWGKMAAKQVGSHRGAAGGEVVAGMVWCGVVWGYRGGWCVKNAIVVRRRSLAYRALEVQEVCVNADADASAMASTTTAIDFMVAVFRNAHV